MAKVRAPDHVARCGRAAIAEESKEAFPEGTFAVTSADDSDVVDVRSGVAGQGREIATDSRVANNRRLPEGTRYRATEERLMHSSPESADHARRIQMAVRGKSSAGNVGADVRHSWSRCLDHYSLDPLQVKKPSMVEPRDLRARREALGALLHIARIEMLNLARQMQHTQCGIVLTDHEGVILCYVGDPAFAAVARRSGFREGAVWSERELGTNGMGTCLMTQRPIVIDRTEHFLLQNTDLTCSAAPIFDSQGRLLAALDISGSSSMAQAHTLVLVDLAAQNIENRALLAACRGHHLMRFHPHAEFVSTCGEGVLAFDEAGSIVGANRSALALLGHRDHETLCGRRMDAIFETSLGTLQSLSARALFRPEALTARNGHLQLFATVQAPEWQARPAAPRLDPVAVDPFAALESDPLMASNVAVARRVLDRDISILLLGETGTGKGHFAKAIHHASRRAQQPFVSVNCAAIPELLIESELFGYRPGAFTGAARQGHAGRILQASGGTLFLDEIGDMPLSLQARLLSVIEDREVLPLGGAKTVPVDIRIISATHRDPVDMIARGVFRDDLYYRLNGVTLTVPPLRKRRDVPEIVRRLVQMEAGPARLVRIDDRLVERLAAQQWPGNVRQLRNALRTMLALCETDVLNVQDFDDEWLRGFGATQASPQPAATEAAAEIDKTRTDQSPGDILASAECEALARTLDACRWNVSAAAVRLHVSRKTMYRMMHRHGLVRRGANGAAADAERIDGDAKAGAPCG